ncbi:MAG: plasmid pRiA4b ORF-3 family protein [Paludibacteraceae bacterium]|nr:plasmid pRiA4b ORF-3 family protein [Paludibacteraceae bacterium]
MIYKITFSCEEGDTNFRRVFKADSESTFLDLHKAILASVQYPDDQMTSFFMCNDRWEKEQEVTLVPMASNFEYDNMVMEDTRLSDLLEEQGQRLIYIFDPMFERYFFGSLKEIIPGAMDGIECVENTGKAPQQLQTEDPNAGIVGKDGKADWETDENFYGDSQYDDGDIDMEGFQDLSFDDGSMF